MISYYEETENKEENIQSRWKKCMKTLENTATYWKADVSYKKSIKTLTKKIEC